MGLIEVRRGSKSTDFALLEVGLFGNEVGRIQELKKVDFLMKSEVGLTRDSLL